MKTIGLIVNPIAGMGGRVGLKGTDGKDILTKAIELGATPEAPEKARRALKGLEGGEDLLIVAKGPMGEESLRGMDINYQVVYEPTRDTDKKDTLALCKIFENHPVDLIFFVGGDGTARDISEAIGTRIPALGVPAGVKIHSPVYGNTPEQAGRLLLEFLRGEDLPLRDEEVIDLDEKAFREDRVETRLYGYLKVPFSANFLQNKKSPSPLSDDEAQAAIAWDVVDEMEEDLFYIIGSGTTPMAIMKELGLSGTVLGVDIIRNKKLVAKDCNEEEILKTIGNERAKLILTPMGGQGYIIGRGNPQISDRVLEKIDRKDVIILSTESKLRSLGERNLIAYTLNPKINEKMTGYFPVKIGYERERMMKVDQGREE